MVTRTKSSRWLLHAVRKTIEGLGVGGRVYLWQRDRERVKSIDLII